MRRLTMLSLDELIENLDQVTNKKPTQRLMIAILYKRGHSVPTIAEWYDMRENTIYDWFDRLENEPIKQAIYDRTKPGRPPKLTEDERQQLKSALEESPSRAGCDASSWSPPLVQRYIKDNYGVEYSLRYTRTIMNRARVS